MRNLMINIKFILNHHHNAITNLFKWIVKCYGFSLNNVLKYVNYYPNKKPR